MNVQFSSYCVIEILSIDIDFFIANSIKSTNKNKKSFAKVAAVITTI